MNFETALKLIRENSNLIGKKIAMGTIDELVIYPNEENAKNTFKNIYVQTLNAKKAIEPFINEDVSISAIINKKGITQKIFLSANLEDVKNELEK